MENKNEMTLEELQQQYDKLTVRTNVLKEKIAQKKKEEENAKKQKLANEQSKRKKEVDEAGEKYFKLLNAYMKDYGAYYSNNDLSFLFKTWNWIV